MWEHHRRHHHHHHHPPITQTRFRKLGKRGGRKVGSKRGEKSKGKRVVLLCSSSSVLCERRVGGAACYFALHTRTHTHTRARTHSSVFLFHFFLLFASPQSLSLLAFFAVLCFGRDLFIPPFSPLPVQRPLCFVFLFLIPVCGCPSRRSCSVLYQKLVSFSLASFELVGATCKSLRGGMRERDKIQNKTAPRNHSTGEGARGVQ